MVFSLAEAHTGASLRNTMFVHREPDVVVREQGAKSNQCVK